MKGLGINPDESTFLCILVCSHAGMVDEGLQIFNDMIKNWKIVPNLKHYACAIDLLSRAGRLDDAYTLINMMPLRPDFEVYGALLSACKVHNNIELGIEISEKLFELKPDDAGHFVMLSNMHALAGNWEGVEMTQLLLRSEGLKKDPRFSSIAGKKDCSLLQFTWRTSSLGVYVSNLLSCDFIHRLESLEYKEIG